jgi:hypothetical protein
MGSRYSNRRIMNNNAELYAKLLEERHLKKMRQYGTAHMVYPTPKQMKGLTRVNHIWKTGDRYYKLAIQYYGTADHWWIIAFYNQRPTEANINVGDVIYIPLPLERMLQYLDR